MENHVKEPEVIPWYDPEKSVLPPEIDTFDKFLFLLWEHLGLPNPTNLQYEIGDFIDDESLRRVLVEAFRGCGKSWITAAYALFRLARNWDCRILVVSAGQTRATNFTTFVLQVINTWDLLAPLRCRKGALRQSKVAFDVGPAGVDQAPSVTSLGINSQLAGSRAWLIISDDVETPANSLTENLREKLAEQIKEYDAIMKPGGRTIFLGTPQCHESVYNKVRTRGVTCRIWPSEVPEDILGYEGCLAPSIEQKAVQGLSGAPTEPSRFSLEELAEREVTYGRSGYRLQFMLDTSLSDAERYPLKLKDIPVVPVDPEMGNLQVSHTPGDPRLEDKELPCVGLTGDRWHRPLRVAQDRLPYTGRTLAIDPSGRGKDEHGYAVGFGLNGCVWIPDAGGLSGGYEQETLKKLAGIAEKHRVNKIILESNFGDGMFTELFRPVLQDIYPCNVEEVRHHTRKEDRIIDTLEPVMNSHRLIMDPRVIRDDFSKRRSDVSEGSREQWMLFYQMTRLSRDPKCLKHDDRLDALAILVADFLKTFGANQKKGQERFEEEALKKLFTGDRWGIMGGYQAPKDPKGFSRRSFRRP